ncbi:MAG: type II CRISPR RNA-guided endonuclease Cas9 [Defluviitaleaceae bacterium]|nr:type II CRISPR RNA-guided endonuclease Cas9 [Defluviitaleaceae bacterium]
MRTKKNYIISLDIGTGSVGWAVLCMSKAGDLLAELIKCNKKIKIVNENDTSYKNTRTNLWGVRLFDGAETAEARRIKRGQRRRILRRKGRINYLREIFEPHMEALDPNFFMRLEESFLQNCDDIKEFKTEKGKGLIFAGKIGEGESYALDADYYREYPSIYHLRSHLLNAAHKVDLRLIYLALHHIVKYRGHFVNENRTINVENFDIKEDLLKFINACKDGGIGGFSNVSEENLSAANAVFKNRKLSMTRKVDELAEIFSKECKNVFTAAMGGSINLEKIFANLNYKYEDGGEIPKPTDFKFSLEAEKVEEKLALAEQVLEEHEIEILHLAKQVYSSMILSGILTKPTLSESMVDKYNTHKNQLAELKNLIKSNKKLYHEIFGENGLYENYIHASKDVSQDEFYKQIKKLVPITNEMQEAIEQENFLPKQRYRVNGEIPYQIHEYELCKILENQKAHYPFLGEECEVRGGKIEFKIQTLMKFRIPYYVGPLALHKKADKNHWIEKKSGMETEKITPWNFEKVVDKDASNTKFIERMTRECSYLPDEKVLPKHSLTYQEFAIYNELMSCGYYGKDFDGKSKKIYFTPEIKKEIVDGLFKKYKKVTIKEMLKFLDANGHVPGIATGQLFGIDIGSSAPKYNASYGTYIDIVQALGENAEQTIVAHKNRFEEIIKWATIFEDRDILKRRIKKANAEQWGHFLTDKQVGKLSKLRYRGWGRLSAKLIIGIKASNGKTILENLKEGSYKNFMRLLEDEKIEAAIKAAELKKGDPEKMNHALVEALAGSPAIKKGIWQSLKVVQELEEFLGKENIGKIVVEFARDAFEQKGKRTKTRWQRLNEIYKKFGSELKDELARYEKDQKALDSERLYLYFLQNGKCMYSGEPLLGDLSLYEVDHIKPQSLITDNSFDNKVIVKRIENQKKTDEVLSAATIRKMLPFWEMLAKTGQVSPQKLANLKREKITDGDKQGFIKRQLVEARQITKHVVNILSEHFKDEVEILTPRAGLTSQFAMEFALPKKNRDINDYHHAHDAFLNGIVATYVYNAYPELKDFWVYGNYVRNSEKTIGEKELKNIIKTMKDEPWVNMETGEIIADKEKTMGMVRKVLMYRNVNIVKKTEKLDSGFGDETIGAKGKDKIPVKRGLDTSLYGGRTAPRSAFAVVVKNAKGEIETLSIPVASATEYENAPNKLEFLKKLYPKKKLLEITVDKVEKYTQYRLPKGGTRFLASYQEAQNGMQMKMYKQPTEKSTEDEFIAAYDLLADFICSNNLFADAKKELLMGKMRENFICSEPGVMLKAVGELMRVTKGSNQGLSVLKELGLGTTNQQLTSSDQKITAGTTLIYRSATGLHETRVEIEQSAPAVR